MTIVEPKRYVRIYYELLVYYQLILVEKIDDIQINKKDANIHINIVNLEKLVNVINHLDKNDGYNYNTSNPSDLTEHLFNQFLQRIILDRPS